MFKGNSCYPFSPLVKDGDDPDGQGPTTINSRDQILVIMRYMDPNKKLPDSFFDSEEVKDYYTLLRKQNAKKQQLLFEDKHFNLSKDPVTRELIAMLYMCLEMDPEDRSSID